MSNDDGSKSENYFFWFMLAFVIWLSFTFLIASLFLASSKLPAVIGVFGDAFNVLNALFSGLAFTAVAITLYYQREDLQLAKADSKRSVTALEGSESAHQETVYISSLATLVSVLSEKLGETRAHLSRSIHLYHRTSNIRSKIPKFNDIMDMIWVGQYSHAVEFAIENNNQLGKILKYEFSQDDIDSNLESFIVAHFIIDQICYEFITYNISIEHKKTEIAEACKLLTSSNLMIGDETVMVLISEINKYLELVSRREEHFLDLEFLTSNKKSSLRKTNS